MFLALSCGLQSRAIIPNAVRRKALHFETGISKQKGDLIKLID